MNDYLHKKIVDYLEQSKNKSVSLGELLKLCPETMKFMEIAKVILSMVEQRVLEEVNGKVRYFSDSRLCQRYQLHSDYVRQAEKKRLHEESPRSRWTLR